MRRSAHHRYVPKPQPFQHIRSIANRSVDGNVAVRADHAKHVNRIERRKIRQRQRIVDTGVHIKNQSCHIFYLIKLVQ